MNELRSRAWRRFKSIIKLRQSSKTKKKEWSHEKNLKLMGRRRGKLIRARQLGIDYPKTTLRQYRRMSFNSCYEIC